MAVALKPAREEVLGRVRKAVGTSRCPAPADATAGARAGDPDHFEERVLDYRARLLRLGGEAEIAAAVGGALTRHRVRGVGVPAGLPAAWRPPGFEVVVDDPLLTLERLAGLDAVVTGSALAIAETGTVVLDAGADQGRRALSLLPDLHICVVFLTSVVADVPDALAALADPTRPVTFISGPSATSDIEMERVEGVHGPRRLEILLVAGERNGAGER